MIAKRVPLWLIGSVALSGAWWIWFFNRKMNAPKMPKHPPLFTQTQTFHDSPGNNLTQATLANTAAINGSEDDD